MQITALSFIAVKKLYPYLTNINRNKTHFTPFYQTIIIKKQMKFKALRKLDNDNVNDNTVICILCLKTIIIIRGDTVIKHDRRLINMLYADMNCEL